MRMFRKRTSDAHAFFGYPVAIGPRPEWDDDAGQPAAGWDVPYQGELLGGRPPSVSPVIARLMIGWSIRLPTAGDRLRALGDLVPLVYDTAGGDRDGNRELAIAAWLLEAVLRPQLERVGLHERAGRIARGDRSFTTLLEVRKSALDMRAAVLQPFEGQLSAEVEFLTANSEHGAALSEGLVDAVDVVLKPATVAATSLIEAAGGAIAAPLVSQTAMFTTEIIANETSFDPDEAVRSIITALERVLTVDREPPADDESVLCELDPWYSAAYDAVHSACVPLAAEWNNQPGMAFVFELEASGRALVRELCGR